MAEPSFEARLGRLERENRRVRVGMIAVLAVVVGLVCMVAINPMRKVVRAQRFEVVDEEGKARVRLLLHKGLSPALARRVSLKDPQKLQDLEESWPELSLCDTHGRTRVAAAVAADGSPRLSLFGQGGQVRLDLSVREFTGAASSGLAVYDRFGKDRLRLGLPEYGDPMLLLCDGAGRGRVLVTSSMAEDGPGLALSNKDGFTRALFQLHEDGRPTLTLCDNEGAVIWEAPP